MIMRQEQSVDNSRNEMLKGMFERSTLAVDLGASDKSSRA